MTEEGASLLAAPSGWKRIVGRVIGREPGPTLIVTGGIHGNEPAGVEASRRVADRLRRDGTTVRGELLFLAGNLSALEEGKRFLALDLNRQWIPAHVADVSARGPSEDVAPEQGQMRELLAEIVAVSRRARGPIHFIDLHTSSANGPPFVTVGDTLRNRNFARRLPLPLILGLEEQVDGALLEYLNNFGFVTMGVEAGHHRAPESVDRMEAVLLLALAAAGTIADDALPDRVRLCERLARASADVPRVIEVRRRHAIKPEERFRMEPGFSNFQPVAAGQLMAHDASGPIHAPESGRVLLPLYQGQGDDGFFICREVRMFWLRLSGVLRRLGANRLVSALPGVRRHPEDAEVLVVDTRIARIYPLEIFHLFGFRKLRRAGRKLIVSRRRFDLDPPAAIRWS